MQRTAVVSGDRLPLLITVGVFVVMAACLPLVLRLDDTIDADRAMYHDMERMLGLQNAYIATGEPPIEVDLTDGETVAIGDREFTVSDGVTLALRASGRRRLLHHGQHRRGCELTALQRVSIRVRS